MREKMDLPKTSEEFYRRVDELCFRLSQMELNAEADRISFRIHKVAWTSAAELFRELYLELRKIADGPDSQRLPEAVKNDLTTCVTWLAHTDPLHWTPEVGPPRS
jgi:hypothetical protein